MSETKRNMTIDEDLANALGVDTSPEQMVSGITMAIKPMEEVTLTVTRLLSPKFIERLTAHRECTVEHTLAGQVLVSSVSKEAGLDIIGNQADEIVRLRARYCWLRDAVLKPPGADDAQKRIWVREFTGPILYGESIDDAIGAAVALEEKASAPPP